MKKLQLQLWILLFALLIGSCKKEAETPIPQNIVTVDEQGVHVKLPNGVILHYATNEQLARMATGCNPATGLTCTVANGFVNYQWMPQGGQHILFTINGITTNQQWFAGTSWRGISFPLTDPISVQLCGTTFGWNITTYCDPYYIGADSSLIAKQYASAITSLSCPIQPATNQIIIHGHRH